ncbi:hypothetical protein HDU78_006342 [Chytriomyces hyalinus]|nr:hypothetical protein HDU78_006342 [Chytriomyces hyalinus]
MNAATVNSATLINGSSNPATMNAATVNSATSINGSSNHATMNAATVNSATLVNGSSNPAPASVTIARSGTLLADIFERPSTASAAQMLISLGGIPLVLPPLSQQAITPPVSQPIEGVQFRRYAVLPPPLQIPGLVERSVAKPSRKKQRLLRGWWCNTQLLVLLLGVIQNN